MGEKQRLNVQGGEKQRFAVQRGSETAFRFTGRKRNGVSLYRVKILSADLPEVGGLLLCTGSARWYL